MKIYKCALVGDVRFNFCVEVDEDLSKNVPESSGEHWNVASWRMSECDQFVEYFSEIGTGWKISESQLAIKLNDNFKSSIDQEWSLLTSRDRLTRRALLFLPKDSLLIKSDYIRVEKKDFVNAIQPLVQTNGLVAFPIEYGFSPLATSCTCKAFFGCTTGCCTNPSCNVVIGICQSNSNCRKVDRFSSCACRED